MKIEYRDYYCPLCGNEEKHQTNHTGEIYCKCKKCGNTGLYFKGTDRSKEKAVKAVFHYYKFNIENQEEIKEYLSLIEKLQKKFEVFETFVDHSICVEWKKRDGKTITIYNPETFDNQYISDIGRVFNWREGVFPNKMIREGYYISFLTEKNND